MRAAWYQRKGPANEVLEVGEQPRPVAGPGELLVRVRASGINPYSFIAPNGAAGRFVQLGLNYSF